jgi:type I restriction enzyme S subunit
MTTEAPLGEIAQLDARKVALAQRLITLRGKRGLLDNTYLKYLMQSDFVQTQLRARATGTTVLGIRQSELRRVRLAVPPLVEQHAIASTLDILDKKIDLNRRTNETLEGIARAVFKSWFVDFDPVRAKAEGRQPTGMDAETAALFPTAFSHTDNGPIPKRWAVRPLADLASYLNRGIAPTYLTEGGVMVINQKCVRDHRVAFDQARRHDPAARAVAGRELQEGDILVNSTGEGTLGRVAQVLVLPEVAIVDTHVTVVRPNRTDATVHFLGLEMLGRQAEIASLAEGTTGQTELSRARLGGLQVLVPPQEVQTRFDALVSPLRARMELNGNQAASLVALRDALLPKLLSGELRIRDAEKMVEAHV